MNKEKIEAVSAEFLVSNGVFESMSNSLTKPEYASLSESIREERNVGILNALSNDLSVMRQSMLFGLLESISHNLNRKTSSLRLFEFGNTYHKYESGYVENKHLAMIFTGNRTREHWGHETQSSDFFYMKGVIQVLLMDRGFLDGETLWAIKQTYGVDFVIPSKDDMQVTAEARALRSHKADDQYLFRAERAGEGEKQTGQVKLYGIKGVTAYDQYGDADHQKRRNRKDFEPNPLNVIVVYQWQGKRYGPGHEKVFLTSLAIDQPLTILDLYDLRSLIENCAFRELKQGWHLANFPKKTDAAVRGHVFLTLVIFTLTNAYRTEIGQELAQAGIRRQRLAWQEANKVLIVAADYYAIFDLEELFIIFNCEPEICWRVDPPDVRQCYGLPDPVAT